MPPKVAAYDLLAIGTGAAASAAAHKCRGKGWRVAVVDERPFGGTCALRGCDPKKVLVGASDLVDWMRRMPGVQGDPRIDWGGLMAFKQTFIQDVPADREQSFQKAGIDTLHGRARFTGPTSLDVGGQQVEAKHILIATGAKPRPLDIPGQEHVSTSTDFLELKDLPRRIVFIGGGYISFEFAHIAARAGAEATILHRSERPLGQFDPGLVDRLVEHSRDVGIDVRLGDPVTAVEMDGNLRVHAGTVVEADMVVHGAGRVPDLDMDLDAAHVAHSARGVAVDRHLRSTTNAAVWAAGDAADTGWSLTPVATMHGHVAAANMLGGAKEPDDAGTASVVFTTPPMARVGLLESEARKQGLDVEVREGAMDGWYSTRRLGGGPAGYKVLVHDGRIIGAHLLGRGAEEHINIFALAIRHRIPAAQLRRVPWAYPSHASDTPYMV